MSKKSLNVIAEVVPFKEFFKAKDSSKLFWENLNNPYCVSEIAPKVNKFLKEIKLTK